MAADTPPPSFDSRTLRHTVGLFATGVTVIAARTGPGADDVLGMTANAFSSLSLDPPLVLFCVGKTSRMGTAIRSASGFSVSILTDGQQHLSSYFAGAWKDAAPPPFSWVDWTGAPRLAECLGALACTVETIHEGGDHWIVCGRVRDLYRTEDSLTLPLLFFRGAYARLGS